MVLLVAHGADLNARWRAFPVTLAPCESPGPAALGWRLEHGADPNCGEGAADTASDYLIVTYVRSPEVLSVATLLRERGGAE